MEIHRTNTDRPQIFHPTVSSSSLSENTQTNVEHPETLSLTQRREVPQHHGGTAIRSGRLVSPGPEAVAPGTGVGSVKPWEDTELVFPRNQTRSHLCFLWISKPLSTAASIRSSLPHCRGSSKPRRTDQAKQTARQVGGGRWVEGC